MTMHSGGRRMGVLGKTIWNLKMLLCVYINTDGHAHRARFSLWNMHVQVKRATCNQEEEEKVVARHIQAGINKHVACKLTAPFEHKYYWYESYAAQAPKNQNAEHAGEIVDLIHMRNFARVAPGVGLPYYTLLYLHNMRYINCKIYFW